MKKATSSADDSDNGPSSFPGDNDYLRALQKQVERFFHMCTQNWKDTHQGQDVIELIIFTFSTRIFLSEIVWVFFLLWVENTVMGAGFITICLARDQAPAGLPPSMQMSMRWKR